jgi:hypothetical protein
MEVINGHWYMEGLDWSDDGCLQTVDELHEVIERVGFMPLFANRIPGFSVENMTDASCWWTGDEETDPWEWRILLTRTGKVAYGKFFGNKAGFVSKKWFPYFANYRRDGYDFDSRYEDGKAEFRERAVMKLFEPEGVDMWAVKKSQLRKFGCVESLYTFEIKERAGFGKDGFKNFEGTLAKLQMQSYLVAKDFRPRLNKKGESFGWAVASMTPPEYLWGYKFVTGRYNETPAESLSRMVKQICRYYDADERDVRRVLK